MIPVVMAAPSLQKNVKCKLAVFCWKELNSRSKTTHQYTNVNV